MASVAGTKRKAENKSCKLIYKALKELEKGTSHVTSVRSHAASGQNGERAVNTSTRIISAECVFKNSVDAATAAPSFCRLAPTIPCKCSVFCMWTCWRVGCQELHLHHFRVKACFRFYLQVDAWTAVPSFCRHAHKIFFFCLQGAQRFNHVALDQ